MSKTQKRVIILAAAIAVDIVSANVVIRIELARMFEFYKQRNPALRAVNKPFYLWLEILCVGAFATATITIVVMLILFLKAKRSKPLQGFDVLDLK